MSPIWRHSSKKMGQSFFCMFAKNNSNGTAQKNTIRFNQFREHTSLLIDEYDHFANDIIARGTPLSKNQYQESVWANSITKDFYETLKIASESVVDKTTWD